MSKSTRRRQRYYPIRRRTKPGADPGTLAVDPHAHATTLDLFAYGPDGYVEEESIEPARIAASLARWPVTWVNAVGLGSAALIGRLAEIFSIHPLALEDIVNAHQRPKVELYGDRIFIVSRMVTLEEEVESEQLSMVLGHGFLLTFQERPGYVLDPVRERIRTGAPIRGFPADYLAYALIDAVVDHYFPLLEQYGERIEVLEAEALARPDDFDLSRVHKARHDLLVLRRAAWPQRDALSELAGASMPVISDATRIYLRDCHDHCVQVMDLVETLREMTAALLEVHLSMLSHRLNEAMTILTVFASVFIPLTFVTGLYGMNFDTEVSGWNMPELEWPLGYPFALALMAAAAAATLLYFRKKGWLGKQRSRSGGASASVW